MKKLFSVMILCMAILTNTTVAQNTFQEIVDSSLQIQDGTISLDGNLILASRYPTHSFSYLTAPTLTKLDLHGNVVWSKSYLDDPWFLSPEASSFAQTKDSGFIIGGRSYTGFFGSVNIVLIHADKDGNLAWVKGIGSPNYGGNDFCYSTISSADGGMVYCGRTINYNTNNTDACIVKVNASGDIMWSYSYGESYFESGNIIIEADDDDLLILGIQVIDSSFVGYPMIFKIDSGGNLLWAKRYEDSLSINDIISLKDGFAGCGFRTDVTGNLIPMLLRFDNDGNLIWNKQFDFNDVSNAYEITATLDDGFLLGSYPSSMIKCDSMGNVEWVQQYGDSTKSGIYLPIIAPDGAYFYCGIFAGVEQNYGSLIKSTDKGVSFCEERTLFFDTVQAVINSYATSLSKADLNYFSVDYPLSMVSDTLNTLVLCSTTEVVTINENLTLSLFPNPFFSSMAISYSLSNRAHISLDIFNLLGQRVKTILESENQSSGNHEYFFTGPGEGIYFVRLIVEGKIFSQKIMQVN